MFPSGGAVRRSQSLTLFWNLEGLRYTAAEFLPSDEVIPSWPVGVGSVDVHQLFIYIKPILCWTESGITVTEKALGCVVREPVIQ